jgi:ABC-type enterochelin transport system substrate-binding protein
LDKFSKFIEFKKKIKIFKTHNMLRSFGKYSFADLNNTAGVIHIVWDPRNVISSLKNQMDEIIKIYNYLKKFFDLNLKNEDFYKILKLSSFENLKKKEKEGKFK